MMRKHWPFRPYIAEKINYRKGQPDRMAATVILFVRTPCGRLSKRKFHAATCYEKVVEGRVTISEHDLTNKAISCALASAPKLPKGYSYTAPCIY